VRTGAYTSPHIFTPLERIQIDGVNVEEDSFCRAISKIAEVEKDVGRNITYFEILTVASLLCHAEAGVEVAAYEVGIGGRLDATQVVHSSVSIITSISYDHMDKLGNTLEMIAKEKCGIIRRGVPVVSASQEKEAEKVIMSKAYEMESPLYIVGGNIITSGTRKNFSVSVEGRLFENLSTRLLGNFQVENCACALTAVYLLHKMGLVPQIEDSAIRKAIGETFIGGRMEVLMEKPLVVVDGSHNGESVAAALSALKEEFSPARILVLFGCATDKDVVRMARAMASERVDSVFVVGGFSPRSFAPHELANALKHYGNLNVRPFLSVEEAVSVALNEAKDSDAVIALGSFYLIPDIVRYIKRGLSRGK
ncbi:MAG: Mur ligase family protein, partial [Planctomycetota bacterium]|nr:Mur ligase family protein [Planctomycetota bacterium]